MASQLRATTKFILLVNVRKWDGPLWASERKHMADVDVAAAGGWRDTRAMKVSYQQADAATQLRVVEAAG